MADSHEFVAIGRRQGRCSMPFKQPDGTWAFCELDARNRVHRTCPTLCDSDCEELCHEVHQVKWKRTHERDQCLAVVARDGRT